MCYIMGDFNLDLLNTDLHSATNEFMNAFFSHFLYPLILRPTRLILLGTAPPWLITFLQTIFLPCVTMDLLLTICLTIYQSSHSVTLIHSSTIKPKESVAICNFSSQNINNAFNNLLCEFDWNSLIYADANAAYNGFLQKYTEFITRVFQ